MRTTLFVLVVLIGGCERGYHEAYQGIEKDMYASALALRAEAMHDGQLDLAILDSLVRRSPSFIAAQHRRDSLLAQGPSIRQWDDSLAHLDSAAYALLLLSRGSYLYHVQDTVEAFFTYIEAMPWFSATSPIVQVDESRRFAELAGEAMGIMQSPNIARIAYMTFERAKQLALDHGDPRYTYLADSSYKAVAREVLTMPDSVRAAFGPPPDRPARIPWVLATLAAAFIAISVAGKSWKATTSPSEL